MDKDYYRRRAADERAKAAAARSPARRELHLTLARLLEERIAPGAPRAETAQ